MAVPPAIAALGIALLLSACQGLHTPRPGSEDIVSFVIPSGSRLILHRDLTLSSPIAELYFQRGQVLSFHEVNEFLPYCLLEPGAPALRLRAIPAGEFRIHDVMREFRFGHTESASAQLLAAGQSFNPYHVLATVLQLQSANALYSLRLSCAHWGMPQSMSHLTLGDIRTALGAIATLELTP